MENDKFKSISPITIESREIDIPFEAVQSELKRLREMLPDESFYFIRGNGSIGLAIYFLIECN